MVAHIVGRVHGVAIVFESARDFVRIDESIRAILVRHFNVRCQFLERCLGLPASLLPCRGDRFVELRLVRVKFRFSVVGDLLRQVAAEIMRGHQIAKDRRRACDGPAQSMRFDVVCKFKDCQSCSYERDGPHDALAYEWQNPLRDLVRFDPFRRTGNECSRVSRERRLISRKLFHCGHVNVEALVILAGDAPRTLVVDQIVRFGWYKLHFPHENLHFLPIDHNRLFADVQQIVVEC